MSEPPLAWYALQVQVKREHLTAELIRRQVGLAALAPRIHYMKPTRRGPVRFHEALFPGYLFVQADLEAHRRHLLAIAGVLRFVGYGERIPQVPPSFVEELRARLGGDEVEAPQLPLRPGDRVTILEGPFAQWEAMISGLLPAKDRVVVLLDFLGRQLAVEVAPGQIEPPGDSPSQRVWKR